MTIRKIGSAAIAFALGLSLTATALAQNPPGQGARGQRGQRAGARAQLVQVPVDALDSVLKLAADQKARIASIRDKYEADAKVLRPAPGAPRDPANAQKLRDLTTQANKDIEAVLTPEQMEKVRSVAPIWTALRAAGVPPALLGQLKLTEDQTQKITAIVQDRNAALRKLTPEERRTQRRQMMQDARTKIEAILTQDQKDAIQKYLKEHPRGRGRRNQ